MKSAKTNVSLEDLLRVKRAEQPPTEFWMDFEQQMRAKQLAAIVEPRPWWAPFIRVGARVSHFQVPVGAAAILAISFVTIREYRSPELNSMYVPSIAAEQTGPASATTFSWEQPAATDNQPAIGLIESTESKASRSVHLVAPVSPVDVSGPLSPPLPSVSSVVVEREPSPSERYIAANLAAAKEADPGLMDDVFGPSIRNAQLRQPARDPLTHVSAPGESRRSRLLATALPANHGSSELVVAASDRVSRSLTEERLYDSISRVGVRGDRVAIKF